jgi:hypothetical protein
MTQQLVTRQAAEEATDVGKDPTHRRSNASRRRVRVNTPQESSSDRGHLVAHESNELANRDANQSS